MITQCKVNKIQLITHASGVLLLVNTTEVSTTINTFLNGILSVW